MNDDTSCRRAGCDPGFGLGNVAVGDVMDRLVSLCKRRGFVFQSSEIYGGVGSTWDYGPLGVEMKRAIRDFWWESMVRRDDIEGLDAAILMHPRVWEASGHVAGFTDPLIDCRNCKHRFRADTLQEMKEPHCPRCGSRDLSEARQFNLMFKTFMGPVEEEAAVVYLRPETAQGIYVNFQNVLGSSRQKIPFGIAQIGKAFRNEITPGNFIFRTREFEQMEMQYFVKPGEDREWLARWLDIRRAWYAELGIRKEKCAFTNTAPTSSPTTRPRLSTSSTSSPSGGRSWRASTIERTSTSLGTRSTRARSSRTSTRRPRNATSPTSWRRPLGSIGRC